jgi:HSP20 family protein
MSVIRRNPNLPNFSNSGIGDFQDEFNRLFNRFFGEGGELPTRGEQGELPYRTWAPSVDISEDQNNYFVNAELPGVKKEDVNVYVENERLFIEGERKHESEEGSDGKDYHRVERFYGKFQRSFRLPKAVDPNKIEANFEDGILKVAIPKTEEAKPKQI